MGSTDNGDRTDKYWAAAPSEECAEAIAGKVKAYREWLEKSGQTDRMLRAWRTYYGLTPNGDGDTSRIIPGGDQGELADMAVNHFAALVRQAMVLITSTKQAFKAISANTDFDSLAQAPLVDGLLEHYDRTAAVSEYEYEATFSGLLLTRGAVAVTWNAGGGKPYGVDPDTGRPVAEGDVELAALTPFDLAYDWTVRDPRLRPWVCFRRPRNRWDLIAEHPDLADKLKGISADSKFSKLEHGELELGELEKDSRDTIEVWEWYHRTTPAVPNGRCVIFADVGCVLFDSMVFDKDAAGQDQVSDFGMQYDELPVFELAPDMVLGTGAGHTSMVDLLGLQEGVDMTATIATSSLNAGGLQNMWMQDSSDLGIKELPGGLNILTSKMKPERIEGVKTDPEVAKFADLYVSWMRQLSGINDVMMGETSKGMPAQLAALMHAAALQTHSRLQRAYQTLVERVRSAIIRLLKKYAHTERVALLAGKAGGYQLQAFSSADLDQVDGVSFEAVNPAMKTYAGKLAMADKLLDGGHISPTQYLTLINTGKLEPLFEGQQANMMRIRRDCELLRQGVGLPPAVMGPTGMPLVDPLTGETVREDDEQTPFIRPLITDTHWLDIPEYLAVLGTPNARGNQAVTMAVTELVAEKLRLWRQMDPLLQIMQGCPEHLVQGLPPPMLGPGGAPGAPPEIGAPNGGGADPLAPPAPVGGDNSPAKPPKLPRPPSNPITGERQEAPLQ